MSPSRLEREEVFPALLDSTSPLREAYYKGEELPSSFRALQPLLDIGDLVYTYNACHVPGCSIMYDTFIPALWKAVALGHVSHEHATFCAEGLRWGFKAGVDTSRLVRNGHRWFRNYKSSLENREAVSAAVNGRLAARKTLDLGPWDHVLAEGVRSVFKASAIFPMGAVEKASQPGTYRPTDDHTRTGLNAATDLDKLKHGLTAYSDIAEWLKQHFFMRVSDVDNAFPLLPLHPDVLPFFLFRWFGEEDGVTHLMVHTCGDFGAAGMPGVFKIFFVDVVVGMARAASVLTLPMAIYVDDCGLIGSSQEQVDSEMKAFQDWSWKICGVAFKALKDKVAARHQLMLGLWWDSATLTRTLDERKLLVYMEMIADYVARPKLTLQEMQKAGGRLQRCLLTFPPGAACLLVSLFTLMVGLKLPWHVRKVSRKVRTDFAFMYQMLSSNLGRGYYRYDTFKEAPEVRSDASKNAKFAGGGYVSGCGRYHFWRYGSRAARHLIDYLEGDVVVVAVEQLGHMWHKCCVPFGVDNMAFQRSAHKGRSKVERLNVLVRELFALMLKYHCVINFFWLSSEDNLLADDLSRDREEAFLEHVADSGFWSEGTQAIRHEEAGKTRTLPENRGKVAMPKSSGGEGQQITGKRISSSKAKGGTTKGQKAPSASKALLGAMCFMMLCSPSESMPLTSQEVSVPYTRSSIFGSALPCNLVSYVEEMLDNRLSDSTWRTVEGGLRKWRTVALEHGWPTIIATDDVDRGPKLVTFVCTLLQDTNLVWGSIESYLWGVRTWMMLQHQADPLMGVLGWQPFAKAAKILSWVPSEPRKRVPIEVVRRIILDCNHESFEEVQLNFLILTNLFTFSRTECPCPKSYSGRSSYNKEEHWNVRDFVAGLCKVGSTLMGMWVRFRKIKQDPRVERDEARGDGDWAFIGDTPGSEMSILFWYRKLMRLMGHRADKTGPFFLDPDQKRPLLYRKALAQFYARQRRVGVQEEDLAGLHGLRVAGYNGVEHKLGEDVAIAHGLWKGGKKSASRYARFDMQTIAQIPRAIIGLSDNEDDDEESEEDESPWPMERSTRTPTKQMSRHLVLQENSPDAEQPRLQESAEPSELQDSNLLPPGWVTVRRETANGRKYYAYEGPSGQKATSRPRAWQAYDRTAAVVPTLQSNAQLTLLSDSGERQGVGVGVLNDGRNLVSNVSPRISDSTRLVQNESASPWQRDWSVDSVDETLMNTLQEITGERMSSFEDAPRPARSAAATARPDRFVSWN